MAGHAMRRIMRAERLSQRAALSGWSPRREAQAAH